MCAPICQMRRGNHVLCKLNHRHPASVHPARWWLSFAQASVLVVLVRGRCSHFPVTCPVLQNRHRGPHRVQVESFIVEKVFVQLCQFERAYSYSAACIMVRASLPDRASAAAGLTL